MVAKVAATGLRRASVAVLGEGIEGIQSLLWIPMPSGSMWITTVACSRREKGLGFRVPGNEFAAFLASGRRNSRNSSGRYSYWLLVVSFEFPTFPSRILGQLPAASRRRRRFSPPKKFPRATTRRRRRKTTFLVLDCSVRFLSCA